MEIERIDDYQTWRIHCGGQRLVIDPWLVDDLQVGAAGRLYRREHRQPVTLRPRDVKPPDLVLLTSALPTHAHRPTLAALDRSLRVVGPPRAVALARSMGFRSTIALGAGSRIDLDGHLALTAIRPRFPFGAFSIGILFESLSDGVRVYLEPHRAPERHPALDKGVDVLITPVERVRMLGLSMSMDLEACVALAKRIRARWVLATGTEARSATGLIPERLWRVESGADAFDAVVRLHIGEGRGRLLAPGERLLVPPRRRRD
ncbi:MAG: MBL fold metallo-hydrolase [Gammaproteobacteria bacterium]|nr:MBL fold metallo-hydrolase [Gammaproteobacteria bacterium]